MTAERAEHQQAFAYYGEQSLSAAFHDLLADNDPAVRGDIEFYANALKRGAHVLELGCGSGRVTIALASRGWHVTGVDLAPAMLRLAGAGRKRLPPARAARVRFALADMTSCSFARTFDAVLVPFYAFNHLPSAEQRNKTLDVIARHLRAKGRAYIHVLPPAQLAAPLDMSDQPGWTIPFNRESQQLRCRPLTRKLNLIARQVTQTVQYAVLDIDGAVVRQTEEFYTYHWFDDWEMEEAATRAHLIVRQTHAEFGRGGDGGSKKMYVLESANH